MAAKGLPLLLVGGAALLLMSRKKKTEPRDTGEDLPDVGEPGEEPAEEPGAEPRFPKPPAGEPPPAGPPIACPEGEEAVEVPPGSGNWQCIVAIKPVPMKEYDLQPGSHTNLPSRARYDLNPPYITDETLITLEHKDGQVWRKDYEGIAVMRRTAEDNKLIVAITEPGEYHVMAHDGGYKGVFIAEWYLKTKGVL